MVDNSELPKLYNQLNPSDMLKENFPDLPPHTQLQYIQDRLGIYADAETEHIPEKAILVAAKLVRKNIKRHRNLSNAQLGLQTIRALVPAENLDQPDQ